MKKKTLQAIAFVIFGDLLMFYQFLFALQEKRQPIIADKHDINELPHELPKRIQT